MNVAVTYLVVDGKILFLFKETRNYFVAPGGKQMAHETIKETAIREFQEETGLLVTPKLTSISQVILDVEEGKTKEFTLFTFFADTFSGKLIPETREGKVSWESIESVEDAPMFIGDKLLLQNVLSKMDGENRRLDFATFHYEDNYKNLLDYKIEGESGC